MEIVEIWRRLCFYSAYTRDKEFLRLASFLLFAMVELCSFSTVTSGKCGGSRVFTDCVNLNSCDGDISSHLQNHHLSRENVCEKGIILAREGLLELTEEQVKNMTVCPAHQFS